MNKVILVGNLGADPETRTAQSGNMVANLRIATSERTRDKEGNWGEQTEWHRVVCFGRTAENVARYLRKGRQIYVEGRIQTRKWTDRDGNERYTTEIVANDIRFLGGGNRDGGGYGGGGGGYGGGSGGGSPSGGGGYQESGSGGYSGGGSGGGDDWGGSSGPDDDIPF